MEEIFHCCRQFIEEFIHSINNYQYVEKFWIFYFIQYLVAIYIYIYIYIYILYIFFLICKKMTPILMPRKEVSWVVGMTITALKTSPSLPTVGISFQLPLACVNMHEVVITTNIHVNRISDGIEGEAEVCRRVGCGTKHNNRREMWKGSIHEFSFRFLGGNTCFGVTSCVHS
jgi:hypothetical protein